MKVKEIATAAGVNPDTVRFYTREGLLRPTRNPDNNYQQYDAEDLRRLRFARKARQLGFSLPEICLLYTSPSPRDRQKSRMPSSA